MRDSKTLQGGSSFTYNAVNAVYLGVRGHLNDETDWLFRASSSLATHVRPSKTTVPSFQQQSYSLRINHIRNDNLKFGFELAYDQGERLEGSVGLMLSTRYNF
jgi:hypothetical protein